MEVHVIEVQHLTKRFGDNLAVDDLSFTVKPGIVTGFLGPNGSGKSTTMRLILGLNSATSGTATINGQRFAELKAPLREAVEATPPLARPLQPAIRRQS
jgi:ABC-2 type transport system ATP-binding protein